MTPQPTPWQKAGLPGPPVVEGRNGPEDVTMGRLVRGRNGKPLLFTDALDAKHVADLASEYLRRDIRRAFFRKSQSSAQQQFALAGPHGTPLSENDRAVVEAFAWQRRRDRGGRKKKTLPGADVDK